MNSQNSAPMSYQFPAVLLAGAPHCGKSVLAYLLSQHLRKMDRVNHYLLRAVPDGEGDWYLAGDPVIVRSLRSKHKGGYTPQFIHHMRTAIGNRCLPLLVDIGGLPRGDQFSILRACTHAILLYSSTEERLAWEETLAQLDVPLIASLCSTLTETGRIEQTYPYLQGSISSLERFAPRVDVTFGALLERVAGLCHYDDLYLEQLHMRRAPFPLVVERKLMEQLDPGRAAAAPQWQPGDLAKVLRLVQPSQAMAVYGRGPVWLAACLAAQALPEPMAIFDARYGWLPECEIEAAGTDLNLLVEISHEGNADRAELSIVDGILEPEKIRLSPIEGDCGIILSGKLPRWAFASLARWLAPRRAWVGIADAKLNAAVVVHSHIPELQPGMLVTKPLYE